MAKKDTKWSWVILGVITFSMSLEVGTIKGLSVLLPELKDQLSSKTWIIGSSISIIWGCGYTFGMFAGPLAKRFGNRCFMMTCGLLASIGLIICACATSSLNLLFGLLLVAFMCASLNVAVGIVPEYFDKYYHIAINTCNFGVAIGILVSPLVNQMFLEIYGWRGALLMLCACNLQALPLVALISHSKMKKTTVHEEKTLLMPPKNVQDGKLAEKTPEFCLADVLKQFDMQLLAHPPFIARVFVTAFCDGYLMTSWLIYIVSFAVSNGVSLKEASIVATWGGVGIAIIRIALPYLDTVFTYKQLIYIAAIVDAVALACATIFTSINGMCITSFFFGFGIGIKGSEIYVAIRDITTEDQYINGVSWYHLAFGAGSIVGATITAQAGHILMLYISLVCGVIYVEGSLFDATGSFTISFLVLSAVSLLIVVSLGLEDIWNMIKGVKN